MAGRARTRLGGDSAGSWLGRQLLREAEGPLGQRKPKPYAALPLSGRIKSGKSRESAAGNTVGEKVIIRSRPLCQASSIVSAVAHLSPTFSLSDGDSYVALPGSHCAHAEWGCQGESEHPRREPGAAVPSWGSQETSASGTAGISTHRDRALARKRRTVISPRSVPSRILPPSTQSPSSSLVGQLLQRLGSP